MDPWISTSFIEQGRPEFWVIATYLGSLLLTVYLSLVPPKQKYTSYSWRTFLLASWLFSSVIMVNYKSQTDNTRWMKIGWMPYIENLPELFTPCFWRRAPTFWLYSTGIFIKWGFRSHVSSTFHKHFSSIASHPFKVSLVNAKVWANCTLFSTFSKWNYFYHSPT